MHLFAEQDVSIFKKQEPMNNQTLHVFSGIPNYQVPA